MAESAMPRTPLDHAAATEWARDRMSDALQLLGQFQTTGDNEELDKAIELARTVTDEVKRAHPGTLESKAGPACFNILGVLFHARYKALQDLDSLEEAIQCLRQAVEGLTDETDNERTYYFNNLRAGFIERYQKTNDQRHLTDATETTHRLAESKGPGTLDHTLLLDTLRALYTAGFESTDDLSYLDRAIQAGESFVEHGTGTTKLWLTALNEVEWLYHEKFRITGNMTCLDDAVQLSKQVVDSVSAVDLGIQGKKFYLLSMRNLAFTLLKRYKVSGKVEDLHDAIETHAAGLAQSSEFEHDEIKVILWTDLENICEVVYSLESSFKSLVHSAMLGTVRTLENGNGPSYRRLLCGGEGELRPHQESPEYKVRREAAADWLAGMAGLFEACFLQTSITDDIELAVVLSFRALQLQTPNRPNWGAMETSRRARWCIWTEHIGKIPNSEIMVLGLGEGTWIPPEILELGTRGGLELETDAFIFVGDELDEVG
jgi:tetratricopeptide (TPR) repeat protein